MNDIVKRLRGVKVIDPARGLCREASALELDAASLIDDLLRAVYVAHGTFKRQLGSDGMGPDSWGDDEHEAFSVLNATINNVEGK